MYLNPRQNAITNSLAYFSYNLVFKPHSTEGISIEVEHQNSEQIDEYGLSMECNVTISFVSFCGGNLRTQRSQRYDRTGGSRAHYQNDRSGLASLQASGRKQVICEEDEDLLRFNSQIYTPQVLFYLAHAQTVIIPFNKRYKEIIVDAFSRLGILPHWRKGSQYYKAILNTNENHKCKIICMEDICKVQQLGRANIQQSNGALRHFKNQVIKVKKVNAYRYAFSLFKNKLMPDLIQTPESEVNGAYQKIMKVIQKVYSHASSSFEDTVSEFHTRAHSKISIHTENTEDHSLKQLKEQIRQILTRQKLTRSPMAELDQECKQFVYESIRELFVDEYEQVIRDPNSISKTNNQIYQKVIEEMSRHIEINYKSLFLFDILLEHMDQQEKVVQISQINEENSKKEESNLDLLLTFEKESMDDLLISQSSLSTEDKKAGQKLIEGISQAKIQIEKHKNYIKYLQDLLKKHSISYFSMEHGTTDSFVFQKGGQNTEKQIKELKSNRLYLENKVQELKKQSNSMKKLQPFSKIKENDKKIDQQFALKNKQEASINKSLKSKQSQKSSQERSMKSITPRNIKNIAQFKFSKPTAACQTNLNVSSSQWRI